MATPEVLSKDSQLQENPFQATSEVLTLLQTFPIIKQLAHTYTNQQIALVRLHEISPPDPKTIYQQAICAFSDFYAASDDQQRFKKIREDWGEKAHDFEKLWKGSQEKI